LRLLLERFEAVPVPIAPFSRAFAALRSGEVAAALLIHEGRLTYEREGFVQVCELGEAWARLTGGLPLPLGANVIRRALGATRIGQVSRVLRGSIQWALAHREESIAALIESESRSDLAVDRDLLDRYLAMYANSDTLDAPADVRNAIDELFARAHGAGLLERPVRAEFAG
jgi:1,4-dihydroxy-6-naphthoate synthase